MKLIDADELQAEVSNLAWQRRREGKFREGECYARIAVKIECMKAVKAIDADKLLKTVREYNPTTCNGASPAFVAGVYHCLREIVSKLIRAMKKEGIKND